MGFLEPATEPLAPVRDLTGLVRVNEQVSSGLRRLDLELPRPVRFEPGQFAMLDPGGAVRLPFRRPFSIMAGDGSILSFLFRVVGRGTARMAGLKSGDSVACLYPLGSPFPVPGPSAPPVLLVAGGVGLAPLHAWFSRHARPGDVACFGAKNGGDVPWALLSGTWQVSVDRHDDVPSGRTAREGSVLDLVASLPGLLAGRSERHVLACGPKSMLRAVSALAGERRWPCHVSVEERMGCGYGVCKGCAVPVRASGRDGWRHASCCAEGPVFDAADLDWGRFCAPDGTPS